MTVSIDRQDSSGATAILTLSSTKADPVYRIYRDGVLVQVTKSNRIVVPLPDGGSVTMDMRDDGDPPGPSTESFIVLEWDAIANTFFYSVEQLIASVWTRIATVFDDGSASFRFTTPQLDVDVSVQFRITPVNLFNVDGTPITPTVTISGAPVPPDVTYTFSDSTKVVTVAAA